MRLTRGAAVLVLLGGWALAEGPPGFVDDLVKQAETMRAAGRYDEALAVLRRARDMDPNDARVGNLYQRILIGKSAAGTEGSPATVAPSTPTAPAAVPTAVVEPVVKPTPRPKPKPAPSARSTHGKPATVPPRATEAGHLAPPATGAGGPGSRVEAATPPTAPAGWRAWRAWTIPGIAGRVAAALFAVVIRQAGRIRRAMSEMDRLEGTLAQATEQAGAARDAETRAREEASARLDGAAQDLSRRLTEARAGWERETAAALEHAAQARGEAEGKVLDKETELARAKSELAEISRRLRESERKAKTREEALQAELADRLSRELARAREDLEAGASRREAELRSAFESRLRAETIPGTSSAPPSVEFHPGQAEIVAQALHLYKINPERGLATLRDLARDPSPAVRRSIAPALEAIGTPEALALLAGLEIRDTT